MCTKMQDLQVNGQTAKLINIWKPIVNQPYILKFPFPDKSMTFRKSSTHSMQS